MASHCLLSALLGAALVAATAALAQDPQGDELLSARFVDGASAQVDGVSAALRVPFAPWRVEDVRAGQDARAELRGVGTVRLEVIGLDGLTAHTDYRVFARHYGDYEVRPGRVLEPTAPGTFSDLPAGTLDLEIRVSGFPMRRMRVVDLAPGEVRVVRTQLTTRGTLRGVLRDARGAPVAGQRIEVTRGEVHGGARGWTALRMVAGARRLVAIPSVGDVRTTNERGEFVLQGLAPDSFAVRVPLTAITMIDSVVEVAPGDGPRIELALPPLYDARLRVLLPESVDATTLAVSVGCARWDRLNAVETFPLDSAGRCTVPRLESGEYMLELVPAGDAARRAAQAKMTHERLDLGGFAVGRYLWLEPGEDPAEIEHLFDARLRLLRD